jgi:RHS repeat-associated protein
VFKTNGVEFHNTDGAAHRLVKQTDGGGNVTGWQLTTPENDVEQYNAQGQLTQITTRAGFVTTLTYTSGKLTSVTDAFGRSLTLAYDGSGNLYTVTDPTSRVYTYGYDTKGRLASATYPDTKTRQYLYENATFLYALTGIVDERNARISTYGYDTNGRGNYTEKTGPDNKFAVTFTDSGSTATTYTSDGYGTNRSYTFSKVNGAFKQTQDSWSGSNDAATFDSNGNPLTYNDRNGNQTRFVYDSTRNLETSRTEAYGTSFARTITTTWHATYRLPATITEPSGVSGVNLVTTFTYDAAGNLTKKNMTAGSNVREWNYTVNSRGQVLTIDGPRTDLTDVTTIAYYADNDTCVACRGQVYTVTNAASQVTTFNSYDLDGRPTQITDPNGVVTTLTYKTRGWLASRSTGGETTSYDYDDAGNLNKVTLPDGSWVSYEYDVAGALVGVGDSLGNSIDYELDVMGFRVGETTYDPNGALSRTLQRVYDYMQRLDRDVGAASQTTIYTYDYNRNLKTITDPLGRLTTNNYDALNRLTSIVDAASGTTTFTYDAKDRLSTVKDPKISSTTNYTYNGLGDLTQQVSPDTGTTAFTYDAAGNVATQTDARSVVTTYTYDTLNRVTAATVTDGTVTYEYDNTTTGGAYAKGKLTKITDPSGTTGYVYDTLGRVTSKAQVTNATPANKTFTVGYSYSSGRQTGITYPSGRAIAYTFDSKGQIASVTVDGSTTILSSAAYFPFGSPKSWTWGNGQAMARTFDLDGRVNSVTVGPNTGTYADLSQVFGYDNLSRLTTANLAAGQTQSFTYDANSNRTNATINAASTAYTYPSTNHKLSSLSGATTRSFTYDNAGNVTLSESITYVYDGRGRMKSAGATNYLVNGLGQRVKKSGGSDTFFAYDEAGHLIGEYDGTGAAIQETLWLGDTPVAVIKPKTGGFDVFYIWSDNLGTPRQITDTSNVSRWEWANGDPFGNNAPNENPASAGVFSYNLRFPGQYFDVETGKHYNYFRDYDPAIGRYIESDPIGLFGGVNTYAYVGNWPLAATDPLGLDTVLITVYDHGVGTHSAVRVDNGKDPMLYDPAGSYCRPKKKDTNQCEPRGGNDTFYGNDANLNNYIKFHKSLGSDVRTLRFSTSGGDESEISKRIDRLGGAQPFYCSRSVSEALSGTGPFKGLSSYFLPGNLHDELQRRGGK